MKTLTYEAYLIARHYEGEHLRDLPALATITNQITTLKLPNTPAGLSAAFVSTCVLMASFKRDPTDFDYIFKAMRVKPDVAAVFIKECQAIPDFSNNISKRKKRILPPFAAFTPDWQVFGKSGRLDPRKGDVVGFSNMTAGFFYDYQKPKRITVIGLFANRVFKWSYNREEILFIRRSKA